MLLVTGVVPKDIEIPFPDDSRVIFQVTHAEFVDVEKQIARASIVKDAGDDPDVTNGATIESCVCRRKKENDSEDTFIILGGTGIGTVTKKGLALAVGEPAINPVPRKMILAAALEGVACGEESNASSLEITITIPDGAMLAEKTLNHRLGIIGGLSVLGTTGIVRPVSADAWTATISASMSVAREAGLDEIILSTGRTSEKAAQELLDMPEEAQAMMGDYLHFSLTEAAKYSFKIIHLSGMWAKIMKCAMQIPQTHVRNGALEVADAIEFLRKIACPPELLRILEGSNTAREIYGRLIDNNGQSVISDVCRAARDYAENVSGLNVIVYLVDASARVIHQTEKDF